MDINPETLSYVVNAVLIPLAGVLVVKLRKAAPDLITAATEINDLRKKAKTVLNVLGHIYALVSTMDDALQDGNLSTEEATEIIRQVKDLAGSPEISALMEEFSAE